jgi:[acyl-carrier-protein] S-malonyltransferase
MVGSGVTHFVECGPGKVLTALNRRVERRKDIAVYAVDDDATIDEAITACWGTTDA